jgi:mannose/fructose/N-acetylgalactosamine-specific phosphotransferase system component IID
MRSFLIQGSWNNRTMLGCGFAFAMLPVLLRLRKGDPASVRDMLQRHSEHFNAHPYLANLALGAACRMEEEGRDPEEIRRFKLAVRGPLGGLGDALVWVGWRPATVLAGLVLALAGASPGATVAVFLVVYNLGHLLLRIWGFKVGLERGSQVGDSLRRVAFPKQADRLAAVGVLLLGGVLALSLHWAWEAMSWPLLLLAITGCVWGLWLGGLVGQRGWRWTFWAISAAIGSIFSVGWLG